MSVRRKTIILLFCLLLIFFSLGLYRLMAARFDAGDIFPPYSSLRSDPLGSKVLYQSFGRLADVTVERNFQKLQKLKDTSPSTIFLLGLSPGDLRGKELEELAQAGHRVVITMLPVQGRKVETPQKRESEDVTSDDGVDTPPSTPEEKETEASEKVDTFFGLWGFRPDYTGLFAEDDHEDPSAELVSESYREQFPRHVTQHSQLVFADADESWNVIYRFRGDAVIMERTRGKGSQVLVSDSYLVSNEAMRHERYPAILAWLAGGNNRLCFDETHLGISRQQGVMVLMRQYRLTGFMSALLVLALLYLWQRSIPFIPIRSVSDDEGFEETSTMDYHAGLVNLLRRNIKEDDLIPTCFNEWLKSLPAAKGKMPKSVVRVREVVEAAQSQSRGERNILGCYRKIAGILAERTFLWK